MNPYDYDDYDDGLCDVCDEEPAIYVVSQEGLPFAYKVCGDDYCAGVAQGRLAEFDREAVIDNDE